MRRSGRRLVLVRRPASPRRSASPRKRRHAAAPATFRSAYDTRLLPAGVRAAVESQPLRPCENAGGGDCMYHAVLDGLRHHVPHHPWVGRAAAAPDAIAWLRDHLATCLAVHPEWRSPRNSRVGVRGEWGTTDDLALVANAARLSVVLVSDAERVWTVITPGDFGTATGECAARRHVDAQCRTGACIYLWNSGRAPGMHFRALV